MDDTTPIYIYSTVNLYVSSAMLNELMEQYKEEDVFSATVEEDFYQDAFK